jgi:excinuclease ABC subunit A
LRKRLTTDARIEGVEAPRAVVTWRVEVADPERYLGVRERLLEEGYRRVLVDGETRDLDEVKPSEVVRSGGLDVSSTGSSLRPSERARLAGGAVYGDGAGRARGGASSTGGQP